MRNQILNSIIVFLVSVQLYAQDLLPYVENYSKTDYQGDNQIWNVAQGIDKAMYFANNHYFVRYDGVKWEKYTLPNKTIIRSIFVDGSRIYSGSYKEFGYWQRIDGIMKYVSLTAAKGIFDDSRNEEIWKIFAFNDEIYFQAFNDIFILGKQGIRKIKLPFQISYCFNVGNKLLLATTTQGVFEMKGNDFLQVGPFPKLENNIIHHIEKHGANTYYFTQKNGVYIERNGAIETWDHPLNTTLKSATINTARFIDANNLVIGTASKGIFLVDMATAAVKAIDRDNVLMNNSILSIGLDQENDLWLGLDNGIAHIEVNSPISIFSDNSGVLGSVYSIATTANGYLLASNHGVFNYSQNALTLIPNSQGQAWDISKFNSTFLIGHNEGTFVYENDNFTKLNSVAGGWNFVKSLSNESFLQSTYCGVVIYNDISNLASFKEIKGLCKPIRYAAQNRTGEIWAADNYRGLYKINYDETYKTTGIVNITQHSKIEKDFGVKIFAFRHEILFLIDRHWYTYNAISGQLEANAIFNTNFSGISDVVSIDDSNFIILRDGLLFLIKAIDNKFITNVIPEKYYIGKIINDNLKVFQDGSKYLLNLDDGFIEIDLNALQRPNPTIITEAYYNGQLFKNKSKIKYGTGIRLSVISGLYGSSKPNLFYKFNKQSNYLPLRGGTLVLNNLRSGKQTVRVFSFDGTNYKQVSEFTFDVARPWYFSVWMILLYVLFTALVTYLYYKWNKIKYDQKLALHEEELKHQKKILELELVAENELNIQQYEKHILELQVQTKSSEVAGKSLSIAKQGEIIESIEHILNQETDLDRLKSEIRKVIKINAVNKHEWEIFESNLNQIHNDFIIRLTNRYPNLTSKDVKLCIYLKMNLASKEIAPLLNISFRGVELHRYRLRKKLGLNAEESLYKTMNSI